MNYINISIFAALTAIAYGAYQTYKILALPKGTKDMVAISDAIAEGASAYLTRQYKVVGAIAMVIFTILFMFMGAMSAFAFLIGAVLSATAGFVGMNVAVRANVRVTEAATT